MESVRIDRWLVAARIFKSRVLATEACTGGAVKVNGETVKPSRALRVGEEVSGLAPRGRIVLFVLALAEKRLSAPLARALYEDRSPPPTEEPEFAVRVRGAGRPTKTERRAISRFRGY
ncbi:MAG: RNA-binding S4 domain-containing protein [Polyangiaceae bacterium]|nr:RNA-binding S4 domain-containing protein [Polyangiaceae bacterium]